MEQLFTFQIHSNRIDIFLGAMDEHLISNKNLSVSHPYYFDCMTWCIQKSKPLSHGEALFRICTDPMVFLVFTLQAIFVTATTYLWQMFEQHPKWDLFKISVNGFACFVNLPCTYKPMNNANRIGAISVYFGSSLFANILIIFVIESSSTLTYDPQVNTIRQLIDDDYKLVGNEFAFKKISERNQVK